MLNYHAILVAEDETFIALDIALAIADAGGQVVGPAARVEEALALLVSQHVAGAILDFSLLDGDITPVVEYMMAAALPFIIQSGVDLPPTFAARFPDLIVRIKPNVAESLVAELYTLIVTDQARRISP